MIFGVSTATKTLQLRLQNKHAKMLRQVVREVKQVWGRAWPTDVNAPRWWHV